jgi:hypothetical protein
MPHHRGRANTIVISVMAFIAPPRSAWRRGPRLAGDAGCGAVRPARMTA